MAIPEAITPLMDPCGLEARWKIAPRVAQLLVQLSARLPFPITLISGYRTCTQQQALGKAGRPAAPCGLSTHVSCPATGVDVWPGIAVTDVVKANLGAAAVPLGFRWGGGSPVDPNTGIPSDWNHLDLGPRSGSVSITG